MLWKSSNEARNPMSMLESAGSRADVVEGLIPLGGITWLYGASMTYKTFTAMSLAAAASCAKPWMGRQTLRCQVVYIGAEGGAALHMRRAAAEMAQDASGPLFVVTERPLLDTVEGVARLHGILNGLSGADRMPCDYDFDNNPELDAAYHGALRTFDTFSDDDVQDEMAEVEAVLCIIDTYSQTSGGDDKSNVSAYVKGLRSIIDAADGLLSFLVVDHATKAGGTYMGSVAKLNDVDSQIEISRTGDRRALLQQRKVKDGVESSPLHIEVVPYVFEGYLDAYGKPLVSMVARDGSRAAKLADLAEGKAGVLLDVIVARGGSVADVDARSAFAAHESNDGIKADSVGKAYRRARDSLLDAGLISDETGLLVIIA